MLALTDPRWQTYKSGYRIVYDATPLLRQLLETGATQALWEELWEELHHQGDVDTASYAVVPYLLMYAERSQTLDWNVFALISVIELARPNNPSPPLELRDAYFQAIQSIPVIVGNHVQQDWDSTLTQSIISCIALARGQRVLARAYLEMKIDAAQRWLEEMFGEDDEHDK